MANSFGLKKSLFSQIQVGILIVNLFVSNLNGQELNIEEIYQTPLSFNSNPIPGFNVETREPSSSYASKGPSVQHIQVMDISAAPLVHSSFVSHKGHSPLRQGHPSPDKRNQTGGIPTPHPLHRHSGNVGQLPASFGKIMSAGLVEGNNFVWEHRVPLAIMFLAAIYMDLLLRAHHPVSYSDDIIIDRQFPKLIEPVNKLA